MIRKLTSGWYTLPHVSPLEGFFSRLFFAVLLVFTLRNQIDFTTEPHPVGLLAILHKFGSGPYLTWLADVRYWEIFKAVFFALLAVYVSGFALPFVLPALAIMHVLPFTLNNSQGYTHHGNQIVSCVLIIQAIAVLYYAWRDKFTLAPPDARLRAWLFVNAQVVVTGMYFISVFTKLDNSGGMWLWNAHHTALDMIKTQRQSFLNRFDPAYAEIPPEAYWMLDHPWSARIFFGSGIFMEFFCVFAIGHRWLAPIIGVSLIVMHRAIDRLMGGVSFLYNELLCLVFLVSLPFFLAWFFERIPNLRARRLAVAGLLLGVPLSYRLQPANVHAFFAAHGGLGQYLIALTNTQSTWNSLEAAEWVKTWQFIRPALLAAPVLAVIGALAGRLLAGPKAQAAAV
jgi:hypothetical protein